MDRSRLSGNGPHLMRPNSFIPTSSTNQQQSGGGGKMGQMQIQQLALQSQLQAQSHGHVQLPPSIASNHSHAQHQQTGGSNYYQNLSGNNHQGALQPVPNQFNQSHSTLPRLSSMMPEQNSHPPPRTLRKSYPSQYGSTQLSQHQVSGVNGSPFYGNLMGGTNGRQSNSGNTHAPPQNHDGLSVQQSNLPHPPQIQPVINQIQQQHHTHKILQHNPPNSESDGLPPTLVESMRTLFDILDDRKQGRVRLSDIESRWENGDSTGPNKGNTGAEPLIKMGVMGYLRKVTPPDGMLTFDRFCSGLRLALVTKNSQGGSHTNSIPNSKASSNIYANNNPSANSISHNNASTTSQRPTSLPITIQQNHNQNTIQRNSRIPGLSNGSKLPTASGSSSGIPISPKNKFNGNLAYPNQNGSMGTARRIPLTQSQHGEQTTVAIVHQPPPPNPKPIGNGIPAFTSHPNGLSIGTIKLTKPSLVTPPNGGFTKNTRYASKNSSLDNLKSDTEDSTGKPVGKVRPPSAPILDTTDDDDGAEYYVNRTSNKRERARSRDRDIEESKRAGGRHRKSEELSFGKRVVSFVTPRQRTLSMPQLQLNKLKPKPIGLDDDSSPSASSSSHSPLSSGETKQGALKSSLKANTQFNSAIPTKLAKQKSDLSAGNENNRSKNNGTLPLPETKGESSNSEKDVLPPPPKPPRNGNGLPLTATTPEEPPLSGSSTASNPSKPQIRQFLQSWKRGVADKRAEDTAPPPPLPVQPPPVPQAEPKSQEMESNTGAVKLRSESKKLNLRRRETARRHTVQSGIDFATLKRLKQLEQERDVLQQGLSVLESGKQWYTKQMEGVDEKISTLTKGGPLPPDQWSESLEERLSLLSCRISEINGLMAVLIDGSSSKIPTHMNLQIPSHLSVRTITRLKEQNRQLTQEVSDCSHRVTQLETEKAMLLRQLFHQKSSHHSEETVYM